MRYTFFTLILLLFGLITYGQTKQGYIDFDKVIQTLPDYALGQKQLETKTRQLQDSLNAIVTEYQVFLQNGLPHNIRLDSTDKALFENRMRTMEKKIDDFQQFSQAEITKESETIETALKDFVVKELEQYCVENYIVSVVYKKAILYCSDCSDFTDDFIDFLKRKK